MSWELLHHTILLPWLAAMVFGIFVGSTPGLTATMAVALIVPISYHMQPAAGLAMIIGVSFTAIFAGDIPATYLRIPGTPASAAATLDGHAMARRGRGPLALQLDLLCSAIGGLIGVALLTLIAPQLARVALKFTSYEYFWLAVMGLSMSALVSQGGMLRGLTAALLGLLLSTIGLEENGTLRFTFGQTDLLDGLQFIPMMIGLFGLAEVFRSLTRDELREGAEQTAQQRASIGETIGIIWRRKHAVVGSSLTGTVIGALPGAGADIAAWGAYGLAQRLSCERKEFGKGAHDGVLAPTSANNAAVASAWIPALVFGVPGDAVTAIVLGAMLVYNITPGPQLFQGSNPQLRQLLTIAWVTQLLLIPAGIAGLLFFRQVMRLPRRHIMAGVLVFSLVGSFSLRRSMFDVYVMIGGGVLGWFLESRRVPVAPLVLGLILGPMVETRLRRGLIVSHGSFAPFFTRPICVLLLSIIALSLLAPLLARRGRRSSAASGEPT